MRRIKHILLISALCIDAGHEAWEAVEVIAASSTASRTSAQVDHRAAQSPVKNQGRRGTCVAFSIAAALETFPGVPTDVSEQLLYATVKNQQNGVDVWLRKFGQAPVMSEGDSFGIYVSLFQFLGTCDEEFLPYNPDPVVIPAQVPGELRRYLELAQITDGDLTRLRDAFGKYGIDETQCEMLDAAAAQDVARLKALLDGGVLAIPVSYIIHGARWSELDRYGNHAGDPALRTIVHPGMAEEFARKGGEWMPYAEALLECVRSGESLVDGVRDGSWRTQTTDALDAYGGHAVTICGYDDRGFLIKNSWSTAWGDGGYCTVSFDYHRLYATQAVAIRGARIRMPSLNPFEQRERVAGGAYRLKVQRLEGGAQPALSLSTWQHAPRDAGVEVVEYDIEALTDGTWSRVARQAVLAAGLEERRGAPLILTGAPLEMVREAASVRVTVRYGDLPLGDGSKPDEFRFLATHRYPAFAPALDDATDLAPVD